MADAHSPTLACDPNTGRVVSFQLYGHELLNPDTDARGETRVNGLPLDMRPTRARNDFGKPQKPLETQATLHGQHFVNQYTGAGLTLTRVMGTRPKLPFAALGVQYGLQRELGEGLYDVAGPGGPMLEAPMHVDSLTLLNWDWRFWGDDTRMIFVNAYSNGPAGENGHVGYEHDTPENAKRTMGHIFRRHYPGGQVFNGAVFYNVRSGHWLAITCRRPHLGYVLNLEDAGRGICFDFTFHATLPLGTSDRLPDIELYHGQSEAEMRQWMAYYATFYYTQPPAWTYRTLWWPGLAWNNEATWTEQGEAWQKKLDDQQFNGIWINLVTDRCMKCGTSPNSYRPDPRHGNQVEFRRMCRRMTDQGVAVVVWMSHSGLTPGDHEIDDDWFIHGIDGRMIASWGDGSAASMFFVNPGHPGYRAYTKRWLDFYVGECGCQTIFFDCLGHPIPPDFKPRAFSRYPGETAVHAISFVDEIAAHVKSINPEAILIGEGTALDMPVEMFTVISNPISPTDGLGPRNFLESLNRHGSKRMTVDSGLRFDPASGQCMANPNPGWEAHNRFALKLLQERGHRDAFTRVGGDLSVIDDLLFVPISHRAEEGVTHPQILLPEPHDRVEKLREAVTGVELTREVNGSFHDVQPGIYRMA